MEQQRKREAADIVVDEEMEEEQQHQQPPPPAADQQQNLHKAAEIQTLQKKFEELNATKSRLAKINRLMDELHQAESDVELSKQDLKETFDELTRDELTTPTQDQLTQDKDQASSIVRSSSSTTKDIVGNVLSSKAKSEFEYELNEQDKTLRNLQQEHQRLMNLKNQLFAMNEKKVESPEVAGTDNAKISLSTEDIVVTSGHQSSPAQSQAQAQTQASQQQQQQQQNQSSINNLITRSSSRLDQQTYPPDYVTRRGSVAFTDFGGPTSQQDFFGCYRRASLDSTISNGNRLEEIQRHTDSIKCILTQLMKEQQQQQQFVAGSTPTPQQQQSLAVSTAAAPQQCCPHMMTSIGSRSIASTSCLCQLAPQSSSTAHLMSASSLLAPLQHACSQQNLYHFDNAGQQQQQQQNFQQFQQQQQQQQLMLSFLLSCQQQMQMQQMEMRHLHQQLLSGLQQKDFNKSSSSNEEDTVGAQHLREQQGLQYTSSFAADKQAPFVAVSPTPPQQHNVDNTQQMITTNDMVKNILACIQQQFQEQQQHPKKCQQSQQDVQQLGHLEDTAGLRRTTSITTGGPHGHSGLPVAVSTPQQQARSPIHQKSSSDHCPLIKQSTTTTTVKPCHSGHVISNSSKSPSSQLHKTCHRSSEIKSMIFDEINAFLSENQQKCQQQQTEEFLLELFKELRRHSLSMTSSSGQLTIDANDQLSPIDQRSIDHMLESIKDLISRYYSNQSSRRNSSDTNQDRQPLTSKSNKYRLKNFEPPTLDKPQTFGGKSSSEKVQTKVNSSKVNSKNDGLGNNKNQNSTTKKINESLMKKAALSTNANMDDLEEQIKLVVDDISPVLRSKAENVCNAQLSQDLRQSIISSTIDKCLPLIGSSMNNTFFKRQLSSILDDTLNKFKGQKLKDCGEELLSDISDVVFNELSFFRLMQNIGNGGSGGGVGARANQSTENNTANGQKFDQSDSSNRKSRDEDDVTTNSLISFDSFIDWQSTLAENDNNNSKQRQNGNSNVVAGMSLYGGDGIEDIVVDDNFDMVTTSFSSSTSSESISMHTAALNDSSSNLPKTLMTAITVLDNEVTSGQPMTTSGQPMTTSGQPMTTNGQPVVTRIYESSCGQSTTTKVQPEVVDIVGDESSDHHPVRPVVTQQQEPQEHVVDSRGTTPPDDLLLDISDDDSLDKDIIDDEDNDNDDVDNRQRDIVGDLSPPASNSSE